MFDCHWQPSLHHHKSMLGLWCCRYALLLQQQAAKHAASRAHNQARLRQLQQPFAFDARAAALLAARRAGNLTGRERTAASAIRASTSLERPRRQV